MNSVLQPPPWKLNGSSLTPQLLVPAHGHQAGPPNGAELLLIIVNLSPSVVPKPPPLVNCATVAYGGPETPLPLSGSAQRHAARKEVPPDTGQSMPSGSGYFSVTYVSLRPTS